MVRYSKLLNKTTISNLKNKTKNKTQLKAQLAKRLFNYYFCKVIISVGFCVLFCFVFAGEEGRLEVLPKEKKFYTSVNIFFASFHQAVLI